MWYNGGICSDPVGLLVHVCNGHVRAILGCKVCISAVLHMWTRKVALWVSENEGYPQIIAFCWGKCRKIMINHDKPVELNFTTTRSLREVFYVFLAET